VQYLFECLRYWQLIYHTTLYTSLVQKEQILILAGSNVDDGFGYEYLSNMAYNIWLQVPGDLKWLINTAVTQLVTSIQTF